MQLKVYVPKTKAALLEALDAAARRTGRRKSALVLEALEAYLARERPALGVFHLGPVELPPRDELHVERSTAACDSRTRASYAPLIRLDDQGGPWRICSGDGRLATH